MISIKALRAGTKEKGPALQEALMLVLLTAVFGIFGAFALAMTYAQIQAHGIVAPGARRPE
ncbi:hypothetical protein VW35_13835 [Devosia soli]|uniref:Uncharacterized protein n=1 Tax=Devosia soli TaxID=361041 RepID=A0A0F5L683_9HYPH|nr:hypothetical protein VW35_13835 [Devosia soli]